MKKIPVYFILILLTGVTLSAQQSGNSSRLKLIFAGDIMGHDTQIASAKTENGYNYDTCFAFLRPYIDSADIAIANLEVSLAGPPYKGYPQFSSPDELISSVKKSGFDLVLTANNHSLDRRQAGMERTIKLLDSMNMIRTGTFKDEEQRKKIYPLIIEKNNIRLAILNYTYGTNGIKVQAPNVVNYIDREQIKTDLQKAKTASPDFIIVTIHWGLEYQRHENAQQREFAEFMIENGADAIIGSHPHVVQPVTTIKKENREALVVYSLGNFISNQRKRYTDGGILFEIVIEKEEKTKIVDYNYLPVWVYKAASENGNRHFVLLPSNKSKDFYSLVFDMSDEDYKVMKLFNDDTVGHLEGVRERE